MIADFTPAMTDALANIGKRSVCSADLGLGSSTLRRLWELGFLKIDMPTEGRFPAYYSLTERGEGAAAILNAVPMPVDHEGPVARIKRTVAAHYKIPCEEMISARRSRNVVRPRQVAMYLTKKLTPKSLPDIGRQFGGRDHTTVIHAVRVVEGLITKDAKLKNDVKTLFGQLVSESSGDIGDKPIAAELAEAA